MNVYGHMVCGTWCVVEEDNRHTSYVRPPLPPSQTPPKCCLDTCSGHVLICSDTSL